MALRFRNALLRVRRELRYEPTEKRVRALHGGTAVLDSRRPLLVWEPRRILPSYAAPDGDVQADLRAAESAGGDAGGESPPTGAAILHGGIPFAVRLTEGEPLSVTVGGATLAGAAFRAADPDLADHVIFDFHAFDEWYEEDEPIVAHPRDPFHRVDIRRSSRQIKVELGGELLAESRRATLIFETGLPVVPYIPRDDVAVDLPPSPKRTRCAYKGEASYYSPDVGGEIRDNLAWSYEDPLRDAAGLAGLIAFWGDRVDLVIDGEPFGSQTDAGATLRAEAGL